ALERGVAIGIIVPEVSNIEIFNPTNTECIRQLMEHQQQTGKGKVTAWLYTGFAGEFSRMAHTKAITVDSRLAVLGSANLTPRSLQSPFKEVLTGEADEHILFNQEIDLYVDDPAFVRRLERALFDEDIAHRSRRLDYAGVLARLEALGGARALQAAELGARLS
ncbi:MAG TPA: phospholipase D-like domain-containing protein, partial [Candidatus Obscuribacterales bacterium]